MNNGDVATTARTQSRSPSGPAANSRSMLRRWGVVLLALLIGLLVAAKVFHLRARYAAWRHPPVERVWNNTGKPAEGPADPEIRFETVPLPVTDGIQFTCVIMGPDHRLWASSNDGQILRYPIRADGTLEPPTVITSLQSAEGGKRLVTGFCFDPASTTDAPVLWVSNNYFIFREAPEWTSKITRMSGKDLQVVEDAVVHLPRPYNDHLTNQPSFGPDGALYIPQGSNSSSGAPDEYWGNRPERLLNGSILRLDVKKLTPGHPLDVLTPDGGGSYDPYTRGAPLTIYAEGLRNAYDLVWADDGRLYVPVNGASDHGNTPAGDGIPALTDLPEAEDDWLDRITPGKYYGHPNPQQHHYVLNGGNPDGVKRPSTILQYPVGTQPDADWEPPILDIGAHCSGDGIIQYHGGAFGGKLDRALLICRYAAGADILCVKLTPEGTVSRIETGMPGMTGFGAALDLTEDPRTGNIYVSEYGAKKITLLRPTTAASSMPAIQPSSATGSDKSNPEPRPKGG